MLPDLKRGDVIQFRGRRQQVVARLEDLIWVRDLFPKGTVGPVDGPHDIEDLTTYGWTKEN